MNNPLSAKKMSILAAVIPGFGTIFKWFNNGVKGHSYAQFLNEILFICRTIICNVKTQIIVIHDNCSIHKTAEVKTVARKNKLNIFSIIAYSPQLNLLSENYFGQMKFFTIYDFVGMINEEI